ncbi:uroplakin-3b-like [Dendropsophus ebraccatus]|uniref:uroplakin-3b-like n=1 Tax=Dendropsophus ebraccatus TaxID=150705 RepID=UPI0038316816
MAYSEKQGERVYYQHECEECRNLRYLTSYVGFLKVKEMACCPDFSQLPRWFWSREHQALKKKHSITMAFHIQLWLLVTLSAVAADYIPQLADNSVQGRVTATTFILVKPQCYFNQGSAFNVWVIVANSTAQLDNAALSKSAPYSSFSSSGYYRTLRMTADSYPCNSVADYLRVGSDLSCFDNDNCNGPLTSPGPYRVKFVVLNAANTLVDQTSWSAPITLRQGKTSAIIDTWPGRRSGGMIVITTILSILLASFLLCLIGTFIVGRENVICCKTEKKELTVPPPVNIKDYKTHIAPENPDFDLYSNPKA